MNYKLYNGDCIEILKELESNSIDSIVTDPPYELGFMGKKWDNTGIAFNIELWEEVLRVLKPGGHLLAFSATRTYHRMAVAIEDAGFEIRDMIEWVYGSGFPKSLNVAKQCEKLNLDKNKFEGIGTALKPSHEPICMARKPLEGTVLENMLKYKTGGLNIDVSRVAAGKEITERISKCGNKNKSNSLNELKVSTYFGNTLGRFPSNLIHDGSDEVLNFFPYTISGGIKKEYEQEYTFGKNVNKGGNLNNNNCYADKGSAARFFKSIIYESKPSNKEKTINNTTNTHPTVKPIALMEYLIKMVSLLKMVLF